MKKPSDAVLKSFYSRQVHLATTFFEMVSLDDRPPEGFELDDNRVLLGEGDEDYRRACQALRHWEMYPQGWMEPMLPRAPLQTGTVVVVLAKAYGLWWKNACRIIESYHVESHGVEKHRIESFDSEDFVDRHPALAAAFGPVGRVYGFTYATLPGHAECGIERFLIVQDRCGQVWYHIRAFSRPQYWLARVAGRLARRTQRRFVRESLQRMQSAVDQARDREDRSAESSADPDFTAKLAPRLNVQ